MSQAIFHWGLLRRAGQMLLVFALIAATAVFAQQQSEDASSEAETSASANEDDGPSEAELLQAVKDAAAESEETNPNGQPPEITAGIERFEPTEEISEDRSVSFPNDI